MDIGNAFRLVISVCEKPKAILKHYHKVFCFQVIWAHRLIVHAVLLESMKTSSGMIAHTGPRDQLTDIEGIYQHLCSKVSIVLYRHCANKSDHVEFR